MKKLLTLGCLLLTGWVNAQVNRPKLVVGLVIDQMRWDYLYRYNDRYTANGFKRLLREGMSCENTMIPYTPTYTAAGHTCVYTGSVPALHGIMGNSWYDRELKKVMYCTDDVSAKSVGSSSAAGRMSPKNLWSSTITDELRLATNFKSKTIAIALKDRGAILPGGHTANAAYWFDNATGGWISSSFYMQQLPDWVQQFNARKLPDGYLAQNWNTLFPINSYQQSTSDSNAYEGRLGTEDYTFPHITSNLGANKYEVFRTTPFGNSFTFDMARAAIEAEQLGKRGVTDFLAVSCSSPDYIGHAFGPNAIETEDSYLRLDRDIASFLSYLDLKIGKGQYILFLTADHGAAHNPGFLKDQRIPSGTFDESGVKRQLNDSLQRNFGSRELIEQSINFQIYLNDSVIRATGTDSKVLKQYIISFMMKQKGVTAVIDLAKLAEASLPMKLKQMLTNGYNYKLSGDLQVIYRPQWSDNWKTGTTHGLWNPYDAHIPLIWFGWNIQPGKLNREVYMTDIAPTLAALLKIQMPNASVGNVITEVVK